MKKLKVLFRTSIILIILLFVTIDLKAQVYTINVNGRTDWSIFSGGAYLFWDEFTILSSTGVTWLRVVDGTMIPPVWERSTNILYDGVPITNVTTQCVKRLPPCEGCYWQGASSLALVALGNGSITIRFTKLGPNPPFPIEGEYLDEPDRSTIRVENGVEIPTYNEWGQIVVNPNSAQPGNTVNIRVTIPVRIRQHISGVTLSFPAGPQGDMNPPRQIVTLPYQLDGVYDYAWTIPTDIPSFEKLNVPSQMGITFTATSNRENQNGQFYTITQGTTYISLASTLYVTMSVQGTAVQLGSNNTWVSNRPRRVGANILRGQEPFSIRWIVNGQEINLPSEYTQPYGRTRTIEDQNALADAGTVTFEVTDANNNSASGTIYLGVKTGMDFELSVQGRVTKPGAKIEWKESSQKTVTARQTVMGELPYTVRWLINDTEYEKSTSRVAQFQFTDQDILKDATSVTFEVTDANNIKKSYTIYIVKSENDDDNNQDQPTTPVGPAPTPPPLTGDPSREPNPTVEWNNRPWLDDRVQACTREYLQNIVLYMENEYIKWENTGLPDNKQKALFTTIDDWGRLLNQYITASGGVDGNWDNPTHFVWSEFNKPRAAERYGRTVDYYCKYECNLLEPSPDDLADDLDNVIDELSDEDGNQKWDTQRIQDAQNNLNDLLEMARSLYSQFNRNYNKFVNEINDQNSNPVENEIVALCIASAQNQFDDHSINKDSIDVNGNDLIAQSAVNSDIDMFEIIRILSEVQVQADDMVKKLAEMKDLLASRGGDIDEIISNGDRLIAQGNVDPEFAQDGGVNTEFIGDGVDNFGDGLQDYTFGNVRRGNVLIVVWDGGNIADDIFELIITGRGSLGTTPPGGRRNFDITLNSGVYSLTLKGVYTDPNSPPCTFGIQVYDRDLLILQEVNSMEEGEQFTYTITIQ